MKHYLITFCCFIVFTSGMCQQILVPYKVGDKFGLSDVNGKLVVEPKYINIKWLNGSYFETLSETILNDTIETSPYHFSIRKNERTSLSGVLYKDKEILKDEPFNNIKVMPGKCILAKCESRASRMTKEQYERYNHHDRFASLFSINGKNIYPDNFKTLYICDTINIVLKGKEKKYILFESTNFNNQYSLFIFDINKQEITDWLLKDVLKLHIHKSFDGDRSQIIDYTDAEYNVVSATLDCSTGKCILNKIKPSKKEVNNQEGISDRPMYGNGGMEDMAIVEAPQESRIKEPYQRPAFIPYFQHYKDSLFYLTDYKEKTYINIPNEITVLYQEPFSTVQYQPLIYKMNNMFGFIDKTIIQNPVYDSLIYMGSYYLAFIKGVDKIRCGILDNKGKVVIPFLYDSIQSSLKQYAVSYQGNNENRFSIEAKKDYSYNRRTNSLKSYSIAQSDRLIVYINGKCGMIDMNNETILPIYYDAIAENGVSGYSGSKSNFIILLQDHYYGLTYIEWNKELKRLAATNTVKPVFKAIPGYFYQDYYSIKDFKLFALYDEHFKFKGYAREDGFMYSNEQQ